MTNNNRNQYDQDGDRNEDRYNQDYDAGQSSNYNRNRNNEYRSSGNWNSGNYGNASYGNQYDRQRDWNQDYSNTSGSAFRSEYDRNYDQGGGWDRNRENYNRGWGNTGAGYNDSYQNRNIRRSYNDMDRRRGDRDWWDRTRDEVSSWFGDDDAERRRNMDRRTTGEHKGKGPKGYTRSDDRIREDVHDRLADDPYVDASDIEVKVENGDVILTGDVTNRDQKRRAEDIIEAVSGVRNVENRIHVRHENADYSNKNRTRGDYTNTAGDYTGTTSDTSGIGRESGTTNEIIRDTGNMRANK